MSLLMNENFGNVELHIHLDGSYRPSTLLEIAKDRNIKMAKDTAEELREYFLITKPGTLKDFLAKFGEFLAVVKGCRKALYRTAYEFIEDCAKCQICYVEARYCPTFLAEDDVTPDEVVKITLQAFDDARQKFHVESRLILAGIREVPTTADDVLALATKYRGKGVVGIDVAGDEQLSVDGGGTSEKLRHIFKEAERLGIHRTVHAGENGPAKSVREAVYEMHAERVGHGYRVLQEPELYDELKKKNIHFETCPTSSRLTSAVPLDWAQHPIHTFLKDNVNFSISTDDPLIIGHFLDKEQNIAKDAFHLDDKALQTMNLNAAKSSFLPENEKKELIEHVEKFNANHKSG